MSEHREIRFPAVLKGLMELHYRNNRRELAERLHVSESALSQYVRGKATPGLPLLAAMAQELDVSLDYLVFGVEPDAAGPDYGDLVAHVEHAISRSQAQAMGLRDFVGRVGAALADQIEAAVSSAMKENVPFSGLTTAEMIRLEGYSRLTRIATADLDSDIILLGPEAAGDAVASGPFTTVVSGNVKRGRDYFYAIPDGPGWRQKARRLREVVAATGGLSTVAVDRHVRFHSSDRALVPGFVLYQIDTDTAAARRDPLLDQLADFTDAASGLVVLATNYQTQIYVPIEPKYHSRLVRDYDEIVRAGPRLSFD